MANFTHLPIHDCVGSKRRVVSRDCLLRRNIEDLLTLRGHKASPLDERDGEMEPWLQNAIELPKLLRKWTREGTALCARRQCQQP